jgi:hypothetical protein
MKKIARFAILAVISAALFGVSLTMNGLSAAEPPHEDLQFFLLEEVFPHVAFGGPWSTSIVLMNVDGSDATHIAQTTIQFFHQDGTPWTVRDSSGQAYSIRAFTLAPLESLTIELPQTGGAIETGWAMVEQPTKGTIGGQAIFRDNGSVGRPTPFEATEPLTNWGEGDRSVADDGKTQISFNFLPYDQTNGRNTCLAVANSASYQTLTFDVLVKPAGSAGPIVNKDGSLFGVRYTLPIYGQTSFCLNAVMPSLKGTKGMLFLRRIDSVRFAVIGLRFDPSGSFTTVFPMSAL